MNKHILKYILHFVPLALWAQSDTDVESYDASADVVVAEVESIATEATSPIETVAIVVDPTMEAPDVPEVRTSLPQGTQVVLELPGQIDAAGASAISEAETISVDFPDEDVRTILRNVADLFDLNLVIPDVLQGRTSIKLRNITWRQVFEVVLEPLGYTYVEDRNIIRIKSIESLTTEPVDTRVFVIANATASGIQASIVPLVDAAAGGKIQVDTRSNSLVITERPSRMNKIQEIIERLDRATDQVMIESKFIEVRTTDSKDIGVDWAFLNDDITDLAGGEGVGFGSRPSVANVGALNSGLVAVFSRNEFAATLSALQDSNDTRLVSNPTVVVLNNQEALFQVGTDFPVREFTVNRETGELESGAVEYRFVGIELKVTPSVNSAGMITLDVHPVVSALGETVPSLEGLEDLSFDTREAQTLVTIKDGYTIALGGLTDTIVTAEQRKIPLLGDLPVFGKLFQNNGETEETQNLIIFLTAKTLNPDGSTYEDIIDPRQIDLMEIIPSDIPGYVLPEEELLLMDSLQEKRQAQSTERSVEEKQLELLKPEPLTLRERVKLMNQVEE